MGAAQRCHEFAVAIVVVHLDGMARRFLELPMGCFVADPGDDIGGTRQAPGDLQSDDARRVVGQPSDASNRPKQPDEEHIVDPRMHHLGSSTRRCPARPR
jgi:hypothetical protein